MRYNHAVKEFSSVEISFARFIFGGTAGEGFEVIRVSGAGYFAGQAGAQNRF